MTNDHEPIPVSVMIFTLNEEVHLPLCLNSLEWCDDIIVIDSFSTDQTKQICDDRKVRFYEHAFEGFGSQRNWALDTIETKYFWILILDADERVPVELSRELGEIARRNPEGVGAYRVCRRFHLWGRWLKRSNIYPTWVVRFIRRDRVRYIDRGHAETQTVAGDIGKLEHDLIDENLKGIDEWFERQNRYARKEAERELEEERANHVSIRDLFSGDPLKRRKALKEMGRRLPGRGLWYFLYVYILRGGFTDGMDGFVYCLMKAIYQEMIVIKKYDTRW